MIRHDNCSIDDESIRRMQPANGIQDNIRSFRLGEYSTSVRNRRGQEIETTYLRITSFPQIPRMRILGCHHWHRIQALDVAPDLFLAGAGRFCRGWKPLPQICPNFREKDEFQRRSYCFLEGDMQIDTADLSQWSEI